MIIKSVIREISNDFLNLRVLLSLNSVKTSGFGMNVEHESCRNQKAMPDDIRCIILECEQLAILELLVSTFRMTLCTSKNHRDDLNVKQENLWLLEDQIQPGFV